MLLRLPAHLPSAEAPPGVAGAGDDVGVGQGGPGADHLAREWMNSLCLVGFHGIKWDFMGFNGDLMGFNGIYPVVMSK